MEKIEPELCEHIKQWPFVEARNLRDRLQKINNGQKKTIVFETGYGPSGLPHIGTFGEVFRTSLVKEAFELLTGEKTKLICFSDDMDGLRKIPENIPNPQLLKNAIDLPLTKVPDPFEKYESFGEYNNKKLKSFLDKFEFEYDFVSATEMYKSGKFNKALEEILKNYEKIINIVLPTLGKERRKTYSPFLPICKQTNKVLQAKVLEVDKNKLTIKYIHPETNEEVITKITNGNCKLQWKVDWAMRWYALGIDYEMSGKDLIESVNLSSKIIKIIKGIPPAGFSYELFLDEIGEKISKSKGNGISVEDWLKYGNKESLSLFMFNQPKRAKKLYFDSIPKSVDDYYNLKNNLSKQTLEEKIENPTWYFLKKNKQFFEEIPVSFSMILNLVSVCSAENKEVIWSYLKDYIKNISPETHPHLDQLVDYALIYYKDRIRPYKRYRKASDFEKKCIKQLCDKIRTFENNVSAEEIQNLIYSIGKKNNYENLRNWFICLYQTILGQNNGPRMGNFFKLYGIKKTINILDQVLNDELAKE